MKRPNLKLVDAGLKDFQRQTVDHVFRRLYTDPDAVNRFLVADEVGLGKTVVAKGVIARAVDALWDTDVERIDVLYVCSNASIAAQNCNRLRYERDEGDEAERHSGADRITLLPLNTRHLDGRRVNFVSFTPGTSFELAASTGIQKERALLYHLLKDAWDLKGAAPQNLLQGSVTSSERWRSYLRTFEGEAQGMDRTLQQAFLDALATDPAIKERFLSACDQFKRADSAVSAEARRAQTAVIGELRKALARSCIRSLQPDLIVLDEFQRFKHLFDEHNEVAELAQELFQYEDAGRKVKLLLLSATPYKMYTLAHERAEDDHFEDFLTTARFLLGSDEEVSALKGELSRYRQLLCDDERGAGEVAAARQMIEARLKRVMCRTERLSATSDRSGMLREQKLEGTDFEAGELASYCALDAIALKLGCEDVVSYWKSCPFPLSFMETDYKLRTKLDGALKQGELGSDVAETVLRAALLDWNRLSSFEPLQIKNPKFTALADASLAADSFGLLWTPPALPYYRAERGAYSHPDAHRVTKTLVFSAWKMVPKAIAALLSYEAERRVFEGLRGGETYEEARKNHRPLLRYGRTEERLTGLPVFALTWPSLMLSNLVDPQALAAQGLSSSPAVAAAEQTTGALLARSGAQPDQTGPEDGSWYWAAAAELDGKALPDFLPFFAKGDTGWLGLADEDEHGAFADHLKAFTDAFNGNHRFGRVPADARRVLAKVAMGSPAVCAFRALRRVWTAEEHLPTLTTAAVWIAESFRTLFNRHDATAIVRSVFPEEPYWERVLDYCIEGNLQAVLDEYVDVLVGALSVNPDSVTGVEDVADAMRMAVSLRTTRADVNDLEVDEDGARLIPRRLRCHFALRFGSAPADDGGEEAREDLVRTAFNSPFRPFVLASTSVGQEGLDFHHYCHRLMHWNLPGNPVDLEQREGRIHRFRGHAVRKNIAARYAAVGMKAGNPWSAMFAAASADKPAHHSDIVPFWVFEGDAHIDRIVPLFAFSSDVEQYQRLKQTAGMYRLALGQPRQEELIEYLSRNLKAAASDSSLLESAHINLSPLVAERG